MKTPEGREFNQEWVQRTDRVRELVPYIPWLKEVVRPIATEILRRRHKNFWVPKEQLETLHEPPFVAAVTHRSDVDPIAVDVLFSEAAKRQGRTRPYDPSVNVGKISLYENPIRGTLYQALGAEPLVAPADSKEHENWDVVRDRLSAHITEHGRTATIFAQGGRVKSYKLGGISPGAADLALQTGVPIVPIAIANTHVPGPIAAWVGETIEVEAHPFEGSGMSNSAYARKVITPVHRQVRQGMRSANERAYEYLAGRANVSVDELIERAGPELPVE